jgi:hypothetical protein
MPSHSTFKLMLLPILILACGDKDDDTGGSDDTGEMVDDTGGGGGATSLSAGFESEFGDGAGCADLVMYAQSPSDELAVHLQVSESLAQQAHTEGAAVTRVWDLSVEAPDVLKVVAGTHVSHLLCNDALEFEPVLERTWVPNTGTATLVVTPNGEPTDWGAYPADAVFSLEGVSWVPHDAPAEEPVPMSDWSIDAYVGWLPG